MQKSVVSIANIAWYKTKRILFGKDLLKATGRINYNNMNIILDTYGEGTISLSTETIVRFHKSIKVMYLNVTAYDYISLYLAHQRETNEGILVLQ